MRRPLNPLLNHPWDALPNLTRPMFGLSVEELAQIDLVRQLPGDQLAMLAMSPEGIYAPECVVLTPGRPVQLPAAPGRWFAGCPLARAWLTGELNKRIREPLQSSVWAALGEVVDPVSYPVRNVAVAQSLAEMARMSAHLGRLEIVRKNGLVPVVAPLAKDWAPLYELPWTCIDATIWYSRPGARADDNRLPMVQRWFVAVMEDGYGHGARQEDFRYKDHR